MCVHVLIHYVCTYEKKYSFVIKSEIKVVQCTVHFFYDRKLKKMNKTFNKDDDPPFLLLIELCTVSGLKFYPFL